MKLVSGGRVAGKVHMIVSKVSGETVRELSFPNLVLDVGYKEMVKRLATAATDYEAEDGTTHLMTHLFLGTGTTEPTFSDTGLENRSGTLAGKMQNRDDMPEQTGYKHMPQNAGNTIDFDNDYFEVWYKWRFAYNQGEAEGVWSEIGLADSTYSNPFTRALIRDGNGDPASVTVLSDEYLTVFYTISFVSEPQDLGSVVVDGVSSNAKFIPNCTYHVDNQTYDGYETALKQAILGMGTGSGTVGGSCSALGALTDIYLGASGSVGTWSSGSEFPGTISYQSNYVSDYLIDMSISLEPTDNDEAVEALVITGYPSLDDRYSNYGFITFDPPLNKRADYRLTIDVDLDLTPEDGPVTGLAETPGSTTLDFTWDAYPNATEYQLVLRQAGTVIEEQTVTAPTATASFTGLTASTEYHLDIKPLASPRNGRRLIFAASTTA